MTPEQKRIVEALRAGRPFVADWANATNVRTGYDKSRKVMAGRALLKIDAIIEEFVE